MTTMVEARLDDRFCIGFQAIPGYDTRVVRLGNGKKKRNVNRGKALRRYTSQYVTFSEAQFAAVLAMFHACAGAGYNFRFKDVTDFRCTDESLGTAPGSGTAAVQLTKTYTASPLTRVRTINKPRSQAFTLYEGGVAKAGTLDTTTGLFTPSSAWTGGSLTWTGEFDVPVCFVSDELPATYEDYQVLSVAIELEEDLL